MKRHDNDDEPMVQASVTPHSEEGHSIHDVDRVDASNIHRFTPHAPRRAVAARRLRALGFEVHDPGGSVLTVHGPKRLFEKTFGRTLVDRHAARRSSRGLTPRFAVDRAETPGLVPISARRHPELASVATGLALSEPVKLFGISVRPPRVHYPHVRLPDDLISALHVKPAHDAGFSGRGIRVAVCDTGFYRHPWFAGRASRVRVTLTSGATDVHSDDVGHGTMVVANLLSVAPGCSITAIKMNFTGPGSFSEDAVAALTMAEASGADIVSCSWGCSLATPESARTAHVRTVEFLLARLVSAGRIVLCATGNFPRDGAAEGEFGFPGQHPDVIAVGGARLTPSGTLRASSYASGFQSEVYAYRRVPDVCGLCGDLPAGVLIMSPVQPGCVIDREAAAAPYPKGDDTAGDDGWCCVSGTSAATPQIAGAAALALEANRGLRHNVTMRALLQIAARDVTAGESNPKAVRAHLSNRARRGPDLATGAGLVDVGIAVSLAQQLRRAATRRTPRGSTRTAGRHGAR